MDGIRRLSGRLWLVAAGLLVAAVVAGSGAAAVDPHPAAVVSGSLRYLDPHGWSLRYPRSLSLEHSTSGRGMATFTEVTVANFVQRRAVVSGRTHDGGFILVRPPLDRAGRFPADGVAFRMLLVEGPPPIGTVADSRFPIGLSTFARSHPGNFPRADYKRLDVPRELARSIDADGQHYQAMVLIGPAASASQRAAIEAVIASLTFPRLHPGEQAGEETVLGPASRYPVGSFTLIHAPGQLCAGSVYRCHWGRQPFYLVHAPGQLRVPDLIDRCEPTSAACTPPGAFYALGWTSEDVQGGYRSACHLRFDRRLEQFYCTNMPARWDRTGRPIRRPRGARFADGLQFAFAKVAWDGHVVFLPGLGGNPPRPKARALLWPGGRHFGARAAAPRFTPSRGVQIQQGFDRAGNPSLLENAENIGAKPRMTWLVCPPGGAACKPARRGVRQLVPTAEALNPGHTPTGSFFKAVARVGRQTYIARSSTWLGMITAERRPHVSGEARAGARVRPIAGSWSGGWSPQRPSQPAGGSIMGGAGPDRDQLSVEACRTATGQHCLNLSRQTARFCLYSPYPVRVPARFAGWYLFAFDQRVPHTQACAEPGFSTPQVEPIVHPDPMATRSAAFGPIRP